MARYHDRYMATLRSRYEAGRMEGETGFLQNIKDQNDAAEEKDRAIAVNNRKIEE